MARSDSDTNLRVFAPADRIDDSPVGWAVRIAVGWTDQLRRQPLDPLEGVAVRSRVLEAEPWAIWTARHAVASEEDLPHSQYRQIDPGE